MLNEIVYFKWEKTVTIFDSLLKHILLLVCPALNSTAWSLTLSPSSPLWGKTTSDPHQHRLEYQEWQYIVTGLRNQCQTPSWQRWSLKQRIFWFWVLGSESDSYVKVSKNFRNLSDGLWRVWFSGSNTNINIFRLTLFCQYKYKF